MQVQPFFDERTNTLTYVVFDATTKDAVIIDPVLDYEPGGGKLWTDSLEKVAAFVDRAGAQGPLRARDARARRPPVRQPVAQEPLRREGGASAAASPRCRPSSSDVFNLGTTSPPTAASSTCSSTTARC